MTKHEYLHRMCVLNTQTWECIDEVNTWKELEVKRQSYKTILGCEPILGKTLATCSYLIPFPMLCIGKSASELEGFYHEILDI